MGQHWIFDPLTDLNESLLLIYHKEWWFVEKWKIIQSTVSMLNMCRFFKRWSKKRHDCESHMLELVKLYWYSLLFNLRWFIIVLFQHAKACRRWTSQQWRIPRARGRNIPKILALLPCSSKSVPKSYYHEKHQRHLKSRVYNGRSVVQQRKTLQGDYEQYICQ